MDTNDIKRKCLNVAKTIYDEFSKKDADDESGKLNLITTGINNEFGSRPPLSYAERNRIMSQVHKCLGIMKRDAISNKEFKMRQSSGAAHRLYHPR